MKLAIYRNKSDGKISSHHIVDNVPEIETRAAEFNSNSQNPRSVEVVELQEDSLEMYLYNHGNLNIKDHKDDLEYMADNIRDLASRIEWLITKANVTKDES